MAIDTLREREDATGGRGFVDDDDPGLLTTISMVFAEKLQNRMDAVDAFVQRNRGFDRVRLNQQEQAVRLAEMDPKDREHLRSIAGRQTVDSARGGGRAGIPRD